MPKLVTSVLTQIFSLTLTSPAWKPKNQYPNRNSDKLALINLLSLKDKPAKVSGTSTYDNISSVNFINVSIVM